ncbi:MAG TPA: toll/interleukin-1 receptor domain-containing protein [Ktedonobacteraceae bacterium]|nr:toll/interleukin-1 receptor domain-containing protein [Ktedonobacteraceae bacterium]
MADPELVKILMQGSEVWNQWREQQRHGAADMRLDLSGVQMNWSDLVEIDLHGADLSDAGLIGSDLRRSNLSKTDLYNAALARADLSDASLQDARLIKVRLNEARLKRTNLVRANINGAEMKGSILIQADLKEANLSSADLVGANLSGADLQGANLSGAKLHNADLRWVEIWQTIFANVDLRQAKGLNEVFHHGPSHVDLLTIKLPQDGSALHFLRSCGIPDKWIDFWRSTAMNPIQYHSCFISYAHQDNDLAHRLHSDLQAHGVRCWFAPHDMKIGDKIRPRIDEAIHLQDKLLLILSEHSVASDWVEHEVETALARERKEKRTILFPIHLDNAILERDYIGWAALVQHERHIGDFTEWKDHDQYQAAFKRLLRDLKQADE